MNTEQRRYLETAPGTDITLQNWARLERQASAERCDELWVTAAMTYLKDSESQEHQEAYQRFRRFTKAERIIIFAQVVADMQRRRRPFSTTSSFSSSTLPCHDFGRRSSVSGDEDIMENNFRIDPTVFVKFKYKVAETDVGQLFLDYQRTSTALVNGPTTKTSIENLGHFFSMNYIWDLGICPKTMPTEVYNGIPGKHTWPCSVLPDEVACLCRKLDEQLAEGMVIDAGNAEGRELRSVTLFYETLEMKLPTEYLSFESDTEGTYCHGAVDALFTRQFPAKSVFKLDWANKESEGSKERRGNRYKPNAIISRYKRELAFVKVKPPREQECGRSYLKDLWKLANLCKDSIDTHLLRGHDIRQAAAVQIFGQSQSLPLHTDGF
ncbi:hypothetical protein BGZ54_009541 [Gamsiella multidivaricata]|nr:hypothetical protein BGZ54_009541 [Gamsiella multidivaricata]